MTNKTKKPLETRQRGWSACQYLHPGHLELIGGRGEWVWTADGRTFLDGVNNVTHIGHSHPRLAQVVANQMLQINTNSRYLHEASNDLVNQLLATFPESLRKCILVCSGSEANDLALRIAQLVTGSRHLICLDQAYHGNTTECQRVSPYGKYRMHVQISDPETTVLSLDDNSGALEDLPRVGAWISETILGCGGHIELPPGYLKKVYQIVRQKGGVCIADEIQTGFGRTGSHFWAFEAHQVIPDLVTVGKSMGNGFPISAVILSQKIEERLIELGFRYFNSFGGSTLGCVVGLEVLRIIRDEHLVHRAEILGRWLFHRLEKMRKDLQRVGIEIKVRGRGLFWGVDFGIRPESVGLADAVCQRCLDQGVMLATDGSQHQVIKIKPPMCITQDSLEFLVNTLHRAITGREERARL